MNSSAKSSELNKGGLSRRAAAGAQTKKKIIESACLLLAREGLHGVNAAALAKQAGVSKGALYHHFPSMDEVVSSCFEKTATDVYGELQFLRPRNLSEYLDAVENVLFNKLLNDKNRIRIFYELSPKVIFEKKFQSRRRLMFDKVIKIMTKRLLNTFEEPISEKHLEKILSGVGAFVTGLSYQSLSMRSSEESREIWSWFRATLENDLTISSKGSA